MVTAYIEVFKGYQIMQFILSISLLIVMYIITNKVFLRKLRWCFCFIIIYSIITLKKNDIKIEKREQILTSFSYNKSSRKYTHILCLRKTPLLILFLKKYIFCSLLVLIKLHQQSYSL